MNNQRAIASTSWNDEEENGEDEHIREIHALTPSRLQPPPPRREITLETSSHRSSNLSMASSNESENFTSMSREFNALVLAGSSIGNNNDVPTSSNNGNNLGRIGEEEETNPLAIVPDNNPLDIPVPVPVPVQSPRGQSREVSVQSVKKEEVESKINAWQNAKIAKINNRFKREDAVINGLESEEVDKATSWMKKVERKLEEKRAKALEKMQNDVAKARRKAEEKRASAEAKKGTKVARVLEIANLMRAVGRPPVKRSFF
ncbi:Remorin family protein [Abeliophyllum distichum]|uniref:Remorin family protein n=1 Tax=Abeliophyllum distichum TaxID=126358 RepID=A0ABD1NN71_9LAMI